MGSYDSQNHFRQLLSFTPDYSPNKISQYESERTGMRVVVIDQEGPKLFGFFVLATEIHDDSGAPHTLEHLCFTGSRSYKYKGFLDKLAVRAYSGTNALTATDHTAYTLETAGWEGFRQILPIYLEHVILPTLTDSDCLTEVHHIDGDGLDAGVVYSEMQGIQNTAQELVDLRIKRLLYPEGVGFRYETGGMMEHLRVLTAERIREFHRDMYQPRNLCVIICGEVNHEELLQTLEEFETSIMDAIPSPNEPYHRPWIDSKQAPALEKSTVEVVEFPEEDEEYGQIDIRFLGPDCCDTLEVAALNVALLYLAGSPAALLDNTLVEREELASGVYYHADSRPKTEITFSLTSVKTADLEKVEQRFFAVLKDAMENKLDMNFIQDCIDRQVRTTKFGAEASSYAFAEPVIADYLFGNRDGSTLKDLSTLKQYTEVLNHWTEDQWKKFIRQYISDANHVSILGKPSAELSENLKKDESQRIEEQKERLGPDGLKKCAEKLEKAKAENDREIPGEMLAKFEVPSTDSIHFVSTASARVGPALSVGKPSNKYQSIIDKDAGNMPLFIDFEHIPSNFVRVYLMISTEKIPVALRPLLAIYLEAFFALPVKRGDQTIDFEKVVVEIERDTVGYDIDLAAVLGNAECLRVMFQVELEKYDVAIKWISELFWHSVFDIERLRTINARLLSDVPDAKRSGETMLTAIRLMVHLAPESISRARCSLVKALYLRRMKSLLKSRPEKVVEQFETLRESFCEFSNFRILVVADLERLKNPVSAWKTVLDETKVDPSHPPLLTPLGKRLERLSPAGKDPGKTSYLVPMSTIDSSYADAISRGPTSFTDPRLPAIMVAIAYMNAMEGPLWVAVRGTGLAYGTNMSYDLEGGSLHLYVYRSPDAYKAYQAARDIVKSHMDGTIEFDPLMLEGAISSIVVQFADEQATLASAGVGSFVREVIRGLPSDYMKQMLKKVRDVSVEDIKAILKDLIYDLFTPGKADVLLTCSTGLKEQIQTGLESMGFSINVHDLAWFQDDYGLKGNDDDQDDEKDEDEDDEIDDEDDDDEGSEEDDEEDETKDKSRS